VQSLVAKRDDVVQSIATSISEFRDELSRHMDTLKRRSDIQAPIIVDVAARMTAFTRSLDQLIVAHHEREDTLAAQKRVIDQLKARIKAFEDGAQGTQ